MRNIRENLSRKNIDEKILEEKIRGVPNIEIGRRYKVSLKYIEKVAVDLMYVHMPNANHCVNAKEIGII